MLAGLHRTIVVYVVNPSDSSESIRKLCELFQTIFAAYASTLRMAENPSDLVLQILPLSWVGSETHITIPALGPCTRLAKIIYNKCPLSNAAQSPFDSGTAFQIARQVPRKIDFKVTASGTYSPLKHSPIAHLGYFWDAREDWLSVALTNDTGDLQWNASYHLGQVSNPRPYFAAVAKEIWEVVGESFDFTQDECKVFVAKVGAFTDTEIESKSALHQLRNHN